MCKFTNSATKKGQTTLDNIFVTEYMPHLSENAIKAYINGLFLCQNGAANNFDDMAKALKMSETELIESFEILQKESLVELVKNVDSTDDRFPFFVFFPPICDIASRNKDVQKYRSFYLQLEQIIKGRALTPSELKKHSDTLEVKNIEQDAYLLIVKYATMLKGDAVLANYITTIATNFANSGATTVDKVNKKLLEEENKTGKAKELLEQMQITRYPTMEERELYINWKKTFHDEFIFFAQKIGYKINTFEKLDKLLTHYKTMNLTKTKEIEAYEQTSQELFDVASTVTKQLGLFYQNLNPVVEEFVSIWFAKGFDKEFINSFAKLCFLQGVRTLAIMDEKLSKLHADGIVSKQALDKHTKEQKDIDAKIKKVLQTAKLERSITNLDRSIYHTWVTNWQMEEELILYAASLSIATLNPVSYMNKILGEYKEKNIKTLASAKNYTAEPPKTKNEQAEQKTKEKQAKERQTEENHRLRVIELRKQNAEFKTVDDALRLAMQKNDVKQIKTLQAKWDKLFSTK